MHEVSCFVTLTYSPEKLPVGGSLNKKHFQDFMKRLRKKHGSKIRFFHCGEYGDQLDRPHYHAIIFGLDFADKKRHSKNERGEQLYKSETLEKLWGHGFCLIGAVTDQSTAYVARYIVKKVTGKNAATHYQKLDPATGEIFNLQPEYVTMSRRPGIGASWYAKYASSVFPSDHVVIRGKEAGPPKYYRKILEVDDPKLSETLRFKRIRSAAKRKADNTPERLLVKEECRKAKTRSLKRTLHK